VLTQENVEYLIGRILEVLARKAGQGTQERDQRRLAQIEAEIERAVELGVRTGGLDAVLRKLDALKAEQAEIQSRLARAAAPIPTLRDLQPLIEAQVNDFRDALEADTEVMRRAMRALLGESRIAVREDPLHERTYQPAARGC